MGRVHLHSDGTEHLHDHDAGTDHDHDHGTDHDHGAGREVGDHTGYTDTGTVRVEILENLLSENDRVADANRRAFAQATWRHLLFGVVLGELERRLNAEPEPAPPAYEGEFSSNGHGTLAHAVSVEPAS